jgi:hypothetical protein
MTCWTTTAIASDDTVMCPSHGLFMNQFHSGVCLRLIDSQKRGVP